MKQLVEIRTHVFHTLGENSLVGGFIRFALLTSASVWAGGLVAMTQMAY